MVYDPLFNEQKQRLYEETSKPEKHSPVSGKPMQRVTVGGVKDAKIPAFVSQEDRVCMPVENNGKNEKNNKNTR